MGLIVHSRARVWQVKSSVHSEQSGSPLNKWVLQAEWMNSSRFLPPVCNMRVHTQPPSRLFHWVIKWLIVEIAFDNSSLCCLRNVFHFFIWNPKSPLHGELAKGRRKRGGGGGKRERKSSGEDRKTLDGEDGKFGECGPIFNSGCQATNEQQGRKGWRERDPTGWWSDMRTHQKRERLANIQAGPCSLTHLSWAGHGKATSTNTYNWLKLEGKQQSSKSRAWHQCVRTGQLNHHPDPVSWKIKSATFFLMTSMLWYKS